MGDYNLMVILDAIRRAEGGLSRVELSAAVGLAPQTVSNICRRLLDQDLIMEAGKEGTGPGKPRTMLRLKPSGMYAVGVQIDPAVTSFALLDVVGNVVLNSALTTDASIPPEAFVEVMAAEVLRLIADSGVDAERVAGVGVATPGPVDAAAGLVVSPPHLPGWTRVALRDGLARATGLPVVMDKDVTAAAVAEMWSGGPNATGSFVFLYIGTGLGAGLVFNDEVMRGSSGNAGEIGHIITDPDGPLCDCGRRGCVKVTCMPETLVEQAQERGVLPVDDPQEPRSLHEQMAALAAAAEHGNSAAVDVLEFSAQRVARAISALTNLLDVERVVAGGPFWPYLEPTYLRVIPALLDSLSATRTVHEIGLTSASSGRDGGAIGAACLVLESTLSPHAAKLLLQG
ncbi:ROK family transcriptional regulator [Arthrobacter sp. 35W]|uniref:ROK family transcriptional regulator n=1 Tax=Arthrobacter sp. 35W TaxID=1132441 RepID=UPI000416E5C9|nr:ROK family transcriptional regulator [Arthrobacter sp. 35W]